MVGSKCVYYFGLLMEVVELQYLGGKELFCLDVIGGMLTKLERESRLISIVC